MTITYQDSKRISGLSTDVVLGTSSYTTDFSTSTGWTLTNTTISSGTLNVIFDRQTQRLAYYDLGSGNISDSSWVLRFKMIINSLTDPSANQATGGIFLDDQIADNSSTQTDKAIGINFQYGNGLNRMGIYAKTNSDPENNNSANANFTTTLATGTRYYEIKRNNSTITATIYSDSSFSTVVETLTATVSGTITGQRYLNVANYWIGSGGTNGINFALDDVSFYNNPSNKPTRALPLTGCKAYYNFEQTSGNLTNIATTANLFTDAMSSIDMTSSGTVTKNSTGKIGSYAWTFDGSTGYASTTRIVAGFSKMTLSAWVYSTGGSVTDEYIFSEGKYFSNDWTVGFKRENGNLRFWVSNTGGDLNGGITSDSSFTANTWHHVVVLYDGSGSTNADKLKLYVDNTQKTLTYTIQNGFPATLRTASNNVSYIGNNDGNSNWFIGKIDDMSIWNRVLSASEISTLYNSGSGLALNTQTAPETNTIAVETDTGYRSYFNGNIWNENQTGTSKVGIFGGTGASANTYTNNFELYTISSNTWDSSNTLSASKMRLGGASSTTEAFILGGQNSGGYRSEVDKVNWSTKALTTTTDTTYAPASTVATAPTFCMVLGYYNAGYYATTRRVLYSTSTGSAGTSLNYSGAFASAFGNKNFGFMPSTSSGTGTSRLEMYTYSNDTVTIKTTQPTLSTGEGGGHSGNRSTGIIYDENNTSKNHTYDIISNTWTSNGFSQMPTRKPDTGVCSTFNDFYAIGTSGTTVIKSNYASRTNTTLASHSTNRAGNDNSTAGCNDNFGVNY